MDAKTSCQLKGLVGVIFGGLALVMPGPVLAFFTGIFWILLIAGMILCILIAITAHSDESIFWFLCAAALLVIGIAEMIFPSVLSFIFVLAVAVLAFYAGYTGISCALTRSETKYYLVGAVIASSIILLFVFLTFVPSMRSFLVMTVVGTISFILGLFAVFIGLTLKEGDAVPVSPHTFIINSCKIQINPAIRPEDKDPK
ncbi:hypothetical protein [Methanoregula sp.]|uniref:hypothetical protein n=1 Tax=Methanoregula sp. TaxID=2052170 RepID=UPI002BD8BED9|nr:hypothetical protein [Methanoregula sp.]HVP95968.1 hypothetical protein [Methanoregula sp.]